MKTKRWKKLYGHTISFVCPYCLKTVPMAEATIDHKNPFARSHDDSPENKVLCCKKCNNEKGALTADEYKVWKYLEYIRHGGKTK